MFRVFSTRYRGVTSFRTRVLASPPTQNHRPVKVRKSPNNPNKVRLLVDLRSLWLLMAAPHSLQTRPTRPSERSNGCEQRRQTGRGSTRLRSPNTASPSPTRTESQPDQTRTVSLTDKRDMDALYRVRETRLLGCDGGIPRGSSPEPPCPKSGGEAPLRLPSATRWSAPPTMKIELRSP